MAQSSWPFENIDTSETQFSQWARNIGEGVKTGALNELEVFADSTGMQVKAKSGQALVRGHYYQSTAQETLTVTAADLSNPRIDTVVLELDPSANSIVLKVIAGSPAAVPAPQPLVQTDAGVYQVKLAEVLIDAAATTIAAGKVTDSRTYIETLTGTIAGSQITGEITVATIDGDRIINQIDTATIPGANVTGNITASQVNGALSNATIDGADITGTIDTATIDAANVTNTVKTESGTTYSIIAGDKGKLLRFTDGTGVTVTVDDVLAAGERIDVYQKGAGVVTFTAGSGVTLEGAGVTGVDIAIQAQYGAATILCDGSGTYAIVGNVAGV